MNRKTLMIIIAVVFFLGFEFGRAYPPHHYVKYYGGRLFDTNTGNIFTPREPHPSQPLSARIKAWYVKSFHSNDVWINRHGWVGKNSALARCYYPNDIFGVLECREHLPEGWVKGFVPDSWKRIDPCDYGDWIERNSPACRGRLNFRPVSPKAKP